MHGDEPCGAEAIHRVRGELERGSVTLERGTLFLIHANPEASRQKRRHTETGADLNRLWDFDFVDALNRDVWGYEHNRVLELKDVVGDLDVFLDLHSATSATPPFAVSNGSRQAAELAAQIGVEFLVESWETLADKVVIGFLTTRDVPALSVECGAHQDGQTADRAYDIARNFIAATGLTGATPDITRHAVRTVHVVETIAKPSAEFGFSSPWKGFERLESGTVIGSDTVTEVRASQRCYAVLPNEDVDAGQDVVYLAVDA